MSTQVSIPGYAPGTWAIDTDRSTVSFQARLLGITNVRGTFSDFEGTIVLAEDPLDSSVNAVIKTASVDSKNKTRDKHFQRDDFFNPAEYPTITFSSTAVRVDGDNFLVDGDLTIRAITKQATLKLEPKGFTDGAGGKSLATFSAHTEVLCTDFGMTCGSAAFAINKLAKVNLEIEAHKKD